MKTLSGTPSYLWAKVLLVTGSIAMLVGALDPLEGSVVIFIGSALVALATYFNPNERRFFRYRILVFLLITVGVGAMWWLSSLGRIGGPSGRSIWWGLLILPYLLGWSMGIWAPGNPRWFLLLGIVVGLWYLTLSSIVLSHSSKNSSTTVVIILVSVAVTTIVGCLFRLRKRRSQLPDTPATFVV